MAVRKRYLKTKPVCKVTFKIPAKVANKAQTAKIVGEFNNWSFTANPMKRLKDGTFTATLDLDNGKTYQFRYFLDDHRWENETAADKFVRSPYGDSENSVIVV
jgi:1,4-alpha-glucan branching enzyme